MRDDFCLFNYVLRGQTSMSWGVLLLILIVLMVRSISKHFVKFAHTLIITSTNCYYNMVCISIYGRRASLIFSTYPAYKLYFARKSLVRSKSRSLIFPLSSDTSHEGLHSLQYSVNSPPSACGLDFCSYTFALACGSTLLNINITFLYKGIPHQYAC